LAEIEEKIKDAEENFGETEIRDAILLKAELYHEYNKYDEAIEIYNQAFKKTI
jgi:26S proteasome regulatory subunit N7